MSFKILAFKDLYYKRTYFEKGPEYYWRYIYYADSGYTQYLFTAYSSVFDG